MIELRDVSFHYEESNQGIEHINLTIPQGECVALIGPSGGGKTTLSRVINGLIPSYYNGKLSGEMLLQGKSLHDLASYEVSREIGSVFQDPKSQFFSSDLKGEVAFSCENYGFTNEEIISRTGKAIDTFRLKHLEKSPLDILSSGEAQKVAIASVYALRPNIYVCDEPTANLDEEGIEILLDVLQRLKKEGCTLIIAEHRVAWLSSIADQFVYIEKGQLLWRKAAHTFWEMSEEVRQKYGIRCFSEEKNGQLSPPEKNQQMALRTIDLAFKKRKKGIFEDKNIEIPLGRITALVGKNGVGKSSFARVVAGLSNQRKGDILLHGEKCTPGKRRQLIWYSANDTSTQFFTSSVTDELLLNGKKTPERLEFARMVLKELGLYPYKDAHPASLSGGQKQRLSIACGILSNREIMIFDEPTSGLDGGNMKIISQCLKREHTKGKTILIITHDKEFISLCCDDTIEF